jgi:hypothetical protein
MLNTPGEAQRSRAKESATCAAERSEAIKVKHLARASARLSLDLPAASDNLSTHALDSRAHRLELLIERLVTAVKMIHAADLGRVLG